MTTFMVRLTEAAKNRAVIAGGVALVAFAAGTGSGYFYARKKITDELVEEFDEKMEAEIERITEWLEKKYKRQAKVEEFATPEGAAEALGVDIPKKSTEEELFDEAVGAIRRYHPDTPPPSEVRTVKHPLASPPRQVNRNIFTDPQPVEGVDFNYDEEVAARSSDKPYIISAEEFEEGDFDKAELTWFEDGVLADSKDAIIPDYEYERFIGSTDNLRFGHRSDQNHLVYIRNEALELDFEVARHGGKYSVAVAGFTEDDLPTQEPMRRPMARASRGDSE